MKKRVLSLLLVGLLLIALLPAAVLAEGDTQPPQTIYTSEECQATAPDAEKSTEKLFDGFVQRQLGKRAPKETAKISGAGEGLTGPLASVYEAILPGLHEVAIGQRASTQFEFNLTEIGTGATFFWTAEELGVEHIIENGSLVAEFKEAFLDQLLMFYIALKADCPYDLYWHDVTKGFYYWFRYTYGEESSWIEVTTLKFSLTVDPTYQNGDQFTVNTTIGQAVVTAGNNVRAILNKYASKSDYEKLRGYNREICDLAEYDYDSLDAYNDGTLVYAGAWQLVWAFDGDPSTNVVCEGYSKAFQHLCDLTNFVGDIHSIIVTGDAGGGHMWNVVRMEDGFNYLMDVTWSDGSSGNEMFFLVGADGAYPTYSFYGSQRTYDEETQRLYGEEKLALCDRNYTPASIAIRTQPQDVTAVEGTKATFTVEASGTGISYQWYGRASAAESWTLMDGATTATLTLIASEDNDGWQYRCRLTNADSELYTRAATLHVKYHVPGEPVRENDIPATCATDGSYDEVVYCTDCGMELSRVHKIAPALGHAPGEPVRENEDPATCTEDGSYDEVVYCADCGTELSRVHKIAPALGHAPGEPVRENEVPATTETAGSYDEVTYCTRCGMELSRAHRIADKLPIHVTFKAQPKSVTVKSGGKATFKVKVKEKHVTYQWYCRAPGAQEWTKIPGANQASYQVEASKANDGWQFRCGVTNETEAFSNPATLTVKTQKPVIKTQPKSLTAKSGKKVKLSVKATGPKLAYTWYSRPDAEAAWTPVADQTKSSLSVVASKANDGSQYYCHIQNADGAVDSIVVTLTVTPEAPTIKTQPKDAKVKLGGKAKFRAKASGKNVTYQWYYRTSEDGEWILIDGATAATYTVTATAEKIGWQYRCLAKNADGQVYSKAATLWQK